jgi:formylglycine-generating enzyme required for sulfatase activity
MRGAVIGAAVVMAAGIAGIGVFAWSSFSGSSGKSRPAKVSRTGEHGGGKVEAPSRSGSARGTEPAVDELPAAPTAARPAIDPDESPRVPGPLGDGPGGARRPGNGPGAPGYDPSMPFQPGAVGANGAAGPRGGQPGAVQSPFPPAAYGDAGSACPVGMVDVGSFCIDATEVTNASYKAFLDAQPNRRLQPAACAWNTDYMPSGGPPPADKRPVVGVDWCDAWLYCAWSGKRMCGTMGGGNNSPGAYNDPNRSEWHHVCTNGGTTQFSYGDGFDGTKCAHSEDGSLAPTGAIASCVGNTPPYDQVYDMSGNAWEWEDSCAGSAGAPDLCRVRGGGQHSSSAEVSCSMDYLAKREATFRTVGIRCCAARRPGY